MGKAKRNETHLDTGLNSELLLYKNALVADNLSPLNINVTYMNGLNISSDSYLLDAAYDGDDYLDGSAGKDMLIGGTGNDELYGESAQIKEDEPYRLHNSASFAHYYALRAA